ncbi:MAG: hypothetical protein GY711_24155 [bacterium]|nr:hypothetical protein [bacterium]
MHLAAITLFVSPTLTQQCDVELLAPDAEDHDWFGASVAIDGELALVGAPYDSDVAQNAAAGVGRDPVPHEQRRALQPRRGDLRRPARRAARRPARHPDESRRTDGATRPHLELPVLVPRRERQQQLHRRVEHHVSLRVWSSGSPNS